MHTYASANVNRKDDYFKLIFGQHLPNYSISMYISVIKDQSIKQSLFSKHQQPVRRFSVEIYEN